MLSEAFLHEVRFNINSNGFRYSLQCLSGNGSSKCNPYFTTTTSKMNVKNEAQLNRIKSLFTTRNIEAHGDKN
jgi:hypothetical protein